MYNYWKCFIFEIQIWKFENVYILKEWILVLKGANKRNVSI